MRPLILLFLLSGFSALAMAQPLTLESAARRARQNSPAAKASAARVMAAEQSARQAIGYRLPSIDLLEIGVRTTNPAEAFAFKLNQERFSMAEFANPALDANNPDPLNSAITRAEAKLPVFTGGMLDARTRQAHLMARAARLEHSHTLNRIAYEASEAWMNLSRAREYHDLMQRAHRTAAAHLDRARAFFDEGMLIPSDMLRAEVYLAEMDEWLARAQAGAELASAALNYQLGEPQQTTVSLDPVAELVESADSLDALVERALHARPDLQAARLKLRAGELETTVARAGFLPELGIVARYEWYDDRLFGDHGESWALMAMAKLNLFKGGSDFANVKKSRAEAVSGAADVQRFQEGVRLEVRQFKADVTSAKLRSHAATAALAAGREHLRILEERFNQGVAKMTDLLDAQTALREVEVRALNARYDLHLAVLHLRLAVGDPVLDLSAEEQ
ncbi:TolC family protein [candidate division KSB1 bacterium]|nr:TolC family protein [candidate division KSB1 bacterium]